MRAAASLEDGDGALYLGVSPEELQEDDVVRDVGDPELGQAGDSEQLRNFLGHDHADVASRAALQERVHVLAESDLVAARRSQVAETVDGHSLARRCARSGRGGRRPTHRDRDRRAAGTSARPSAL